MALEPSVASQSAVVQARDELLFPNRFGGFDAQSSEFVIVDPLTPRPWVNVMANERYGLVLSQLGGGFSWFGNCQLGRISRWEQDLAVDAYGRWLYVFDEATEAVHSTTFAPVRESASSEEVRHGLGYTEFRRVVNGLETSHTVFVPIDEACEHWIVEIRNISSQPKRLRIGLFLDLHIGAQAEWHREFHRLFVTTEVRDGALFAWKRPGLEEGSRTLTHQRLFAHVSASGLPGLEWFTDKAQWLGRGGRHDRPEGLVSSIEPNNTGRWDDPVAAFRAPVELEPGETVRFAVTIGAEDGLEGASRSACTSLEMVDRRFEDAQAHFRARAAALEIHTSDAAFDLLNNAWLPHQAEVGRMLARCAYYQQGGAYGYRDQLQDSLGLLETDPKQTLEQLWLHAEAMYEDGGVRHWWFPDAPIFVESRHSDTCLWLAFGVLEYLDETADLECLQKPLAYLDRQSQRPAGEGTLLDHCQRGIERFLSRRSPRGLPLIGSGDWNDGLSHAGIEGKGESVWLAMFGFHILRRMARVLGRLGDEPGASRYEEEAECLRQAVETYGWDGEWYIAGTDDEGRPFGSKSCSEGKIFLNPQTWAVISGIASPERARQALESARRHLLKPYGALLLAPAYQETDPYIGYITRYAPGLRENGGVYSHASTWAVQAFAMAGDLDTAYALYRGMMPPLRTSEDADAYQAEPYVMPGNVDGPDSPYEGRAGWTWYTGSAAWMRRVAMRWLLGVRAEFEGLHVDGQLPVGLSHVTLRRPFRGEVRKIDLP